MRVRQGRRATEINARYERMPFMPGAPEDEVSHSPQAAEAQAFAAAVKGGELGGASIAAAVATTTADELAPQPLQAGRPRAAA